MSTTDDIKTFKEKRTRWIECLSGEDPNSVRVQLYELTWNAAAFRVINEARGLAPAVLESEVEGEGEVNGLLHCLLDQCFFHSQLLAIRRLSDEYGLEGKKGVFSLASLIEDMRENACLFNRGNMFAAEGLEYDVDSAERHIEIDELSGASAEKRSPGDTIRPQVFEGLKGKVTEVTETSIKIRTYVHTFLAHSATPNSRAYKKADDIRIELGDLWRAHESLCRTAEFLSGPILNAGGHAYLARPQGDQFVYIDKPLVTPENVAQLREYWKAYEKQTQAWQAWNVSELVSPVSGP